MTEPASPSAAPSRDRDHALGTYPGEGLPRLRVRIPRGYQAPFHMEVGQRNARFVKRPLTPLDGYARFAGPLKRQARLAGRAVALVPEPDHDLVHTQNVVPLLTRRPYIVTFESYLPRVTQDRPSPRLERWLRGRLLSEQCVAVIAKSDYARRQFRAQSADFADRSALEAKMHLLYAAVPVRRDAPKSPSGVLRLLFVGRNFIRKGGPAVLEAHERLRRAGVPVETTIVSSLRETPNDFFGPSDLDYIRREHARVRQEGVVHQPSLTNAEVERLMDRTDYFLAPTLQDTFGFAQVQALAGGTPVLASDAYSQPEIVEHGRSGFLVPLDTDGIGRWSWVYRRDEPGYLEAYAGAVADLGGAMADRLAAVWEDAAGYEALSAGALAHVRRRFDPAVARDTLERLYESCRR